MDESQHDRPEDIAEDNAPQAPSAAESKTSSLDRDSQLSPAPATSSGGEEPSSVLSFIYKIDSEQSEANAFELSLVLSSIAKVLTESVKTLEATINNEISINVRPFESGSFVVHFGLRLTEVAGSLASLFPIPPETLKQVLENIGLIKPAVEAGTSLLDLLRGLKGSRPDKVEKREQSTFEYQAADGAKITVNAPVHQLYNNPTIINNYYGITEPARRTDVAKVEAFLKGEEDSTKVTFNSEDAASLLAIKEAKPNIRAQEPVENTSLKYLKPKSGTYGESTGSWNFTVSGTTQKLKATISDASFLERFGRGEVRFFKQDVLKVRIIEKQYIRDGAVISENDIVEVLDYIPADPARSA